MRAQAWKPVRVEIRKPGACDVHSSKETSKSAIKETIEVQSRQGMHCGIRSMGHEEHEGSEV